MKTLLHHVHTIESQAHSLIKEAKEEGANQLREIQDRKPHVMQTIQEKAHAKAQNIVREYTQEMGSEINQIAQEAKQSVDSIHKAAEANRKDALSYIHKLFIDTYTKS